MNPNANGVGAEPNKTTEQLAIEAFEASEHVRALEMMNTPTDYDDRKGAFVQLALAREAASKARRVLDNRVGSEGSKP